MKRRRTDAWARSLAIAAMGGLIAGCQSFNPYRETTQGQPLQSVATAGTQPSAAMPQVDLAVSRASNEVEHPREEQEIGLHLDLARAFERDGQLEKANNEYRKAVARVTSSTGRKGKPADLARLQRRLAAAYDRLGQVGQAQARYQLAKKLAPRDALVWNDSGYSAAVRGDWHTAESDLRKALELDPTNPLILNNLGLTLAARGNVREATALLERAGGPKAASLNLGYILAATGKTEQARQQYKQVLKAEPDHKLASQALAQLDRPRPADTAVQKVSATLEQTIADAPAAPSAAPQPPTRGWKRIGNFFRPGKHASRPAGDDRKLNLPPLPARIPGE